MPGYLTAITISWLYVDDIVAAEDSQSGLEASGGGLYIGVAKDYTPHATAPGLFSP